MPASPPHMQMAAIGHVATAVRHCTATLRSLKTPVAPACSRYSLPFLESGLLEICFEIDRRYSMDCSASATAAASAAATTTTGGTTSNRVPAYLCQAHQSSQSIQSHWIRSVLKEGAASVLRQRVRDRALQLQARRKRRTKYYDDDDSISSIEDDLSERSTKDMDKDRNEEEVELTVTQRDIDEAYKFAQRLGQRWAQCLENGDDDGTGGLDSSAELVLKVVEAGKYLEYKEDAERTLSDKTQDDSESGRVEDESVLPASLAQPQDAVTIEGAMSRLSSPPALLVGNNPFGKPLNKIPPNPVYSATVATMAKIKPEEVDVLNEAAEQWRKSIGKKVDELGRDGKTRWVYPYNVIEKACENNARRMGRFRLDVSEKTAQVGVLGVASGDESNGSGRNRRGRKRSRPASSQNDMSDGDEPSVSPVINPRPPSAFSTQRWTNSDIHLLLSEKERKELNEEYLHDPPKSNEGGDTEAHRPPSPLPPACVISGNLQHLGCTQLWEKHKTQPTNIKVDDDAKKLHRKRKKAYRKAKFERIGGQRAETKREARLDIDGRYSKVVRTTVGGSEEYDSEEGRDESFELDLGGCVVEIEGTSEKEVVSFRSMELSLSLDP